ncbi:MAG TPA: hypothetical protein VKV28_01605 [Candidatus Binataceae bacterium]|nr:hypothetical protein [Candidatus Binataceae bacterium]
MVAIAIASAIVFGAVRWSLAQEGTPALDMLLNLDLFTPTQNAGNGRALLDQLRTLNDLGLMHRHEGQDQPPPPSAASGNTLQIPSAAPPSSDQPYQAWGAQDQPPPGPPLEGEP